MSDDLVRVRNKETGEELIVGASHIRRWPDDFDVIDEKPAASAAEKPGEVPSAFVDQSAPDSRF